MGKVVHTYDCILHTEPVEWAGMISQMRDGKRTDRLNHESKYRKTRLSLRPLLLQVSTSPTWRRTRKASRFTLTIKYEILSFMKTSKGRKPLISLPQVSRYLQRNPSDEAKDRDTVSGVSEEYQSGMEISEDELQSLVLIQIIISLSFNIIINFALSFR